MKVKTLIFWMAIFLTGSVVFAQDDNSKFGDNPDKCHAQLSTYDQFYTQGNFKDAYTAWSWCFLNCPQSTKNIYIQGPKILKYMIKNSEGDAKSAYIDTLLSIYDQRAEYFGDKGLNLGRKAIEIMQYRSSKAMLAYQLFQQSVELDGVETEVNILGRYMQLSTLLVKNNLIDTASVISNYANISRILDEKIANGDVKAEKGKEQVDAMIVNSGLLDCGKLESIFTPMYEQNPDDVDLLKTIQKMMNSQECFSSKLYAKVSESIYETEKSSNAAHSLAQYFFKNNNSGKAEKYYKEAIGMQEDESKKADLYFELGLLYYNQMDQYSQARTYARKALSVDPSYGRAYKLIAQIYDRVASECGENSFEHKAVYWVAVDNLIKARNVDPSLSESVNPMIVKFSNRFPSTEDAFFYNILEGQTYTLNCWIGESTIVRFNK